MFHPLQNLFCSVIFFSCQGHIGRAVCKCRVCLGRTWGESVEPWKLQVFNRPLNAVASSVARSGALTFYRVTVMQRRHAEIYASLRPGGNWERQERKTNDLHFFLFPATGEAATVTFKERTLYWDVRIVWCRDDVKYGRNSDVTYWFAKSCFWNSKSVARSVTFLARMSQPNLSRGGVCW